MLEFKDVVLEILQKGLDSRRNFYYGILNGSSDTVLKLDAKYNLAAIEMVVFLYGDLFGLYVTYDLKHINGKLMEIIEGELGAGSVEGGMKKLLGQEKNQNEISVIVRQAICLLGVCNYYRYLSGSSIEEAVNTLVTEKGNPFNNGYVACVDLELLSESFDLKEVLKNLSSALDKLKHAILEYQGFSLNDLKLIHKNKKTVTEESFFIIYCGLLSLACLFLLGDSQAILTVSLWLFFQGIYMFERHALPPTLSFFVGKYHMRWRYFYLIHMDFKIKEMSRNGLISQRSADLFFKFIRKSSLNLDHCIFLFIIPVLSYSGLFSLIGIPSTIFMVVLVAARAHSNINELLLLSGQHPQLLAVAVSYLKYYIPYLLKFICGVKELRYTLESVSCKENHGGLLIGAVVSDRTSFFLGDPVARVPKKNKENHSIRSAVAISNASFPSSYFKPKTFVCRFERKLAEGEFHSVWEPHALPACFHSLGSVSYISTQRINVATINLNSENPSGPSRLREKLSRIVCLHKILLKKTDDLEDLISINGFNVQIMDAGINGRGREVLVGSGSFFLSDSPAPNAGGRNFLRLKPTIPCDGEENVIREIDLPAIFVQVALSGLCSVLGFTSGKSATIAIFSFVFILSHVAKVFASDLIGGLPNYAGNSLSNLLHQAKHVMANVGTYDNVRTSAK